MTETASAPNNRSVTFRRKPEREMSTHQRLNAEAQPVEGGDRMEKPARPVKSASWNSAGQSHSEQTSGNPPGVANTAPMKAPSKAKRKRAKSAIKRGLVSEKAAKRHLGDY